MLSDRRSDSVASWVAQVARDALKSQKLSHADVVDHVHAAVKQQLDGQLLLTVAEAGALFRYMNLNGIGRGPDEETLERVHEKTTPRV